MALQLEEHNNINIPTRRDELARNIDALAQHLIDGQLTLRLKLILDKPAINK